MTEYWKSNPHFWCEYCKVWMNDNPSARATHERGIKHQENVARKLRQMRQQADTKKRDQAHAERTMADIEARAERAYKEDLRERSKAEAELTGTWVEDAGTGYLYNNKHQYYFDRATGMYYGGEPAAWTIQPAIPPEARYKPVPAPSPSAAAPQKPPATSTKGGVACSTATRGVGKHPLAGIGGYQMPAIGAIGGAKGIGGGGVADPSGRAPKRQRDNEKGNTNKKNGNTAISQAEQDAIARREAARMRVQQRTMQAFGLK